MTIGDALKAIYSSYNSLDELINPFKLHSRLLDYCNDSFENKRLANLYTEVMAKFNFIYYLENLNKNDFIAKLKEGYKIANISSSDYQVLSMATISLKYSDPYLEKKDIKPKVYKIKPILGQVLYYTDSGRVYHISNSCKALRNAKNIMYKTCYDEDEVRVCKECMNMPRVFQHLRLNSFERVYLMLKRKKKEEDIRIRVNGDDLSEREIKKEIIGGR